MLEMVLCRRENACMHEGGGGLLCPIRPHLQDMATQRASQLGIIVHRHLVHVGLESIPHPQRFGFSRTGIVETQQPRLALPARKLQLVVLDKALKRNGHVRHQRQVIVFKFSIGCHQLPVQRLDDNQTPHPLLRLHATVYCLPHEPLLRNGVLARPANHPTVTLASLGALAFGFLSQVRRDDELLQAAVHGQRQHRGDQRNVPGDGVGKLDGNRVHLRSAIVPYFDLDTRRGTKTHCRRNTIVLVRDPPLTPVHELCVENSKFDRGFQTGVFKHLDLSPCRSVGVGQAKLEKGGGRVGFAIVQQPGLHGHGVGHVAPL
eukprot:m.128769 g.128769  ORF g.128769 m.128769 type:complete len:318 (+) comp11245_c0_seq4:2577-3530(+)